MTGWRLPSILLPEGDRRDLWVADGAITARPARGAELLPGRFALPGLVDAHAHVAIRGLEPLARDAATANLRALPAQGVLLVRDMGAPASVTLAVAPDPLLPRMQAAGRFHAPDGLYFPQLHDPVAPADLVEAALAEVARGARWVKVIADWMTEDLSYPAATLRDLVVAVHAAGGRVAVHTTRACVRDVVAAGVDSVEHGSMADPAVLRAMAAGGTGWTPTITAVSEPLPADATDEQRARQEVRLANLRTLLPLAVDLGIPILAGTDTAGSVLDEVRNLIGFGLTPTQALRAATTDARRFLGAPGLEDGARADVVTFDADPRDDPGVLGTPTAVLLDGRRVR